MLDYKDIIVKHYVLHLTGAEIARQLKERISGRSPAQNACS